MRTSLALALLALATAACSSDSGTRSSDPAPLANVPVREPPRFGYIRAIDMDSTPPTIRFDAAEFLSGEAATKAAVEDGAIAADEMVPNDYYIRNPEPAVETLPVAAGVRVTAVRCPTSCREGVAGDFEALAASFEAGEKSLADDYRGAATQYWITVASGSVVAIDEKYLP